GDRVALNSFTLRLQNLGEVERSAARYGSDQPGEAAGGEPTDSLPFEQSLDVLGRDRLAERLPRWPPAFEGAGLGHEGVEELGLAPLQRQHLLLDRALGDVAVDHDRLRLPDPVGAVDGLILGGGVPPRVHEEDVVRLGEVEAEAAGLEADEEHRGLTGPERLDHGPAVPRRPVEDDVGDAAAIEVRGDLVEERGE